MKLWIGLGLIAALCGCGQDRTNAGSPDLKLPLLEPDPPSTAPLGEQAEVIFEEHRREAGSATTVISQLVVRCQMKQEFHAQGTWGSRYFSLTGTLRKTTDPGWVALNFTYDSWHAHGPLKEQTTAETSLQLTLQTRTLLGGIRSQAQPLQPRQPSWTSPSGTDVTAEDTMLYVWVRPGVTPFSTQPLTPKP